MATFDPSQYWENRLSAEYNLEGVGQRGCGACVNRWAYRARRRVFLRTVRRLGRELATADVLDLGSGTGFYLDRWHELGVRSVTGADLTEVAAAGLRRRYPRDTIHRVDIGGELGPLQGQCFDFVSCMDVLFHIVDDAAYSRALGHVCSLLKPGGRFIFSEGFVTGTERRTSYIVHRRRAAILEHLGAAGLTPDREGPFLVLLNDPVKLDARLMRLWWRAVGFASKRFKPADFLLGPLIYPFELGTGRWLRSGPSTKIMVCRRADDPIRG